MFSVLAALFVAAGALALPVPDLNQRQTPTCYEGVGDVTVVSAISNAVIGNLAFDLVHGRIVIAQNGATALWGVIDCPGIQSFFIDNLLTHKYEAVAAAAVYNATMAVGSPNWALLTTSPRTGPYTGAVNLGNAWTDATGVPAPTKSNMFTFQSTSGTTENEVVDIAVSWTNPDGSTVPLQAFASNDGMLIGVTADFSAFEAVVGYDDATSYATYTPVIFQMAASPVY